MIPSMSFLALVLVWSTRNLAGNHQCAQAFSVAPPHVAVVVQPRRTTCRNGSCQAFPLWMNNNENHEDGIASPARLTVSKKRVRRKSPVSDGQPNETTAAVSTAPPPERKTRNDSVVVVPILDVRDLVGGTTASNTKSNQSGGGTGQATDPSFVTTRTSRSDTSLRNDDIRRTNNNDDDPLARLLLDAKEMQEQADKDRDNNRDMDNSSNAQQSGSSLVATLQQVMSTVVTIDFFFVLALLAWFLAGIFCSTVLKDDGVQIAFNSNFERITQPALGVLMIAALSDAVLKRDEDDDNK